MNMVTNINVRKMWKSVRTKCVNSTKKKKVDSDSILASMRSVTCMEADKLPHSQNKSLEIQRVDDMSSQYNVMYTTSPKDQYKTSSQTHMSEHTFTPGCVRMNTSTANPTPR